MDLYLGDTQLILKECRKFGCTKEQTAYILATAYWETARTMKPVKEAYWKDEGWRKRNLRYYPWYGRGYVQLTWERNYELAEKRLGMDLTTNPDDVMSPVVASKILVIGSMQGWFTGKKIPNYINNEGVDFMNARRVINGTDRAEEIAGFAKDYLSVIPDEVEKTENPFLALLTAILKVFKQW